MTRVEIEAERRHSILYCCEVLVFAAEELKPCYPELALEILDTVNLLVGNEMGRNKKPTLRLVPERAS